MKKVSIIGFGRFGKTLYKLLQGDFLITVYDQNPKSYTSFSLAKHDRIAKTPSEAYESRIIFLAVPIAKLESVLKAQKKYIGSEHILIDVLSVKLHPAKVFAKLFKRSLQILLTHPMFGPDSAKNSFKGLPIVMDRFLMKPSEYAFWKKYFLAKELRVVELSARKHDKLAADSQGLTHFVGRLLEEFNFERTEIDTVGACKLHEVKEQTCNDSRNLFVDLQNFNPYTKIMRLRLGRAYDRLYNSLLPDRISAEYQIFGIQGGAGSFNEEALRSYVEKKGIKPYRIKYLYTTEKVLKNLIAGNVDFGLFAIENAVGGMVEESIQAMAKYKFSIIEQFGIPIRHFLMKRKDVDKRKIVSIMAHDQVFAQCKHSLSAKYPYLRLKSGRGDLLDTARAAWALSLGKLPKTTAILGPKILTKLYDLEIVDENLQDDKEGNITKFLMVKR